MLTNLFAAAKMKAMQSNQASKRTRQTAEKDVSTAPETLTAAESTSKPRSTKSSKPKNETGDAASARRHRKAQPVTTPEQPEQASPVVSSSSVAAIDTTQTTPTEEQIRERAYAYWLERGGQHGSQHEDWIRAERELTSVA
jgi:Protein of unknown function (DUF2934)